MLSSILQSTKLALALHHELLVYAGGGGRGGFYDADLGANIPTTGDIDFSCQLSYAGLFLGTFCHFCRFFYTQPMIEGKHFTESSSIQIWGRRKKIPIFFGQPDHRVWST